MAKSLITKVSKALSKMDRIKEKQAIPQSQLETLTLLSQQLKEPERKVSKDDLKNTTDHLDLIGIWRTQHLTTAEQSCEVHMAHSVRQTICWATSPNKFKELKIIFFDHKKRYFRNQ